jgi:hypothetical protein
MWAIAVFTTAMSSISMAVAKQVTMRVGRLDEVMRAASGCARNVSSTVKAIWRHPLG